MVAIARKKLERGQISQEEYDQILSIATKAKLSGMHKQAATAGSSQSVPGGGGGAFTGAPAHIPRSNSGAYGFSNGPKVGFAVAVEEEGEEGVGMVDGGRRQNEVETEEEREARSRKFKARSKLRQSGKYGFGDAPVPGPPPSASSGQAHAKPHGLMAPARHNWKRTSGTRYGFGNQEATAVIPDGNVAALIGNAQTNMEEGEEF